MNLQSGGNSFRCSKESNIKRSLKLKGRVFTEEWRRKIGEKSKGRMIGYKHTEEAKEKARLNRTPAKGFTPYNKGKGFSKEEIRLRHNQQNRQWRLRKKLKLNEAKEEVKVA